MRSQHEDKDPAMSPVLQVCKCGKLVERKPCPECQRDRNNQPNRRAHRSTTHRNISRIVLARDTTCVYRHTNPATTIDYVTPLSKSGTMTLDNAVGACRSCNSSKGAKCATNSQP
jgi:5-methylcytosine-specific restriction endonuclease McrA